MINNPKLRLTALDIIVPLLILLLKFVVILKLSSSLLNLLVFTKSGVGVEESVELLAFSVILKQQMEDGQ